MATEPNRRETDLRMLFSEYHKRLMHEYDLGWQQLKISMSVAGAFLGALLLIYKSDGVHSVPPSVLKLAPVLGLMVSLSSLLTQLGSLRAASEIRAILKGMESELDVPDSIKRYSSYPSYDLTTIGHTLLQIAIVLFWLAAAIISLK